MNLKIVVAVAALTAMPALAQAQQGRPAPNAPKPTKAEVERVVKIISADKAKTQTYCELGKLNDQIAQGRGEEGQSAAPSAQQARRRSRAEDRIGICEAYGRARGYRRELQGRPGTRRDATVTRPTVQPAIAIAAVVPAEPAKRGESRDPVITDRAVPRFREGMDYWVPAFAGTTP